jgi:hypothetical protein
MTALAHLPDHARLLLRSVDPPFTPHRFAALVERLAPRLRGLAAHGALLDWAVDQAADGRVLIIATVHAPIAADPLAASHPHAPHQLSGCSLDQLGRVLGEHGEAMGQRLLDAPPLVLELAGGPRCVDRAGLRALVRDGVATAETPIYDLAITDLGTWRRAATVPLGRSRSAGLLAAPAAGSGAATGPAGAARP